MNANDPTMTTTPTPHPASKVPAHCRSAAAPARLLVPCFLWVALLSATLVGAAEFHVTPTGSPKGNGTLAAPWDLATALVATKDVQPGDTVWLHAGTYRGGFTSRLSGRPDAPVVVRGVRSGRVTVDTRPRDERDNGLLSLAGADAIYRDFEVTCTDPRRETKIAGSWPADIRRGGVDVRGGRNCGGEPHRA